MGVLVKQVQDGPVGCLQLMSAAYLDQFSCLGEAVDVGALQHG
jgi:hypothetical protein